MRSFEFFEPKTIGEASALLAQYNGEAELLGGGTDLIIGMKERALTPKYVISLEKVPGIEGITYDESNGLWVGAMTKMRAIERSSIVRERYTALAEGAEEVGSIQIRNLATLGGNIAHGSPAADTAAALLVLDARVNIANGDNERTVPIADFFLGPRANSVADGRNSYRLLNASALREFRFTVPQTQDSTSYGSCFRRRGNVSKCEQRQCSRYKDWVGGCSSEADSRN